MSGVNFLPSHFSSKSFAMLPFQYGLFSKRGSGPSHDRHRSHVQSAGESFSQQFTHGQGAWRCLDAFAHHLRHSSTRCFQTPGSDTHIVQSVGPRCGMRLPFGNRLKYSGCFSW